AIDRATEAYQLIEDRPEPYLAIRLDYPGAAGDLSSDTGTGPGDRGVRLRPAPAATGTPRAPAEPGIGWLGAGAFSTGTLLPALQAAGFSRLVSVASAGG